ncbi:nuclear transport factor 2 family protein [Prolixibacteraceae bacterium Z1-6]|uniref:Nuclear transport factor 2 family protein n=1 Tax=Draconibacterium aestuarii TaxID=2998507 RepID=A0A9X3FE80_9BACT|nr:nuclear transport factor 2 family protein [Prolixibacteraceae bacterium Z1-6]
MNKLSLFLLPLFLGMFACQTDDKKTSTEKWKAEIIATEEKFAEMAAREGIAKAFLTFAADDAVLMRNDSVIIGKKSIQQSFKNTNSEPGSVSLTWQPDFVDVSSSGDLGYTYGKYVYSVTDSLGLKTSSKGIFHTVWKRQPDGKWRFVWD